MPAKGKLFSLPKFVVRRSRFELRGKEKQRSRLFWGDCFR
ncbi:hypothetical protein M493_03550 [Geobacillus genomosp. 3]|uniref:Uncharacterized protein n=1 Tax=Geobacillus genomosp. 3 TaxID=1921421 RepID=S5Z211_GEOG3|nr:hypothetical protein M493_03550 [Geobacillus genomosp. 3]